MRSDYSLSLMPLTGIISECGDAGYFKDGEKDCLLAHMDALGHGGKAHLAAQKAISYLEENYIQPINEILTGLHAELAGTVGMVAALCRIEKKTGEMVLTGIGNIRICCYGREKVSLHLREGVIGYGLINPVQIRRRIAPGDILIFTSDGIKEHFREEDYPDLLIGNADQIAGAHISLLSRGNDDASCSVLRYGI